MDSVKINSDEQILLKALPCVAWKQVFQNLSFEFPALQFCSQVSDYLDDLIKRNGHLSIISGDASRSFRCVPRSTGFTLFPDAFLPKPQITAIYICVSPTFEPINEYLEWLIESQRDSLDTLHVSCFGNMNKPFELKLPEMSKLRVLRIERNAKCKGWNVFSPSLTVPERPFLPSLETLTLSASGYDKWYDLLHKPIKNPNPEYSTCETVMHLRFLPADPTHVRWTTRKIGDEFVLPNLVSLEIPAIRLDFISKIFPDPGNLKRLTLTLPSRGLHEHLFDIAITGYGEQACATFLANIRKEIEEKNARHLADFERLERLMADNELRREERRFPNLTRFTGLEELTLKSYTANWGPTIVSYPDLQRMTSLNTLRFCGFYPKYIPDEIMRKLRERFTVITPNFDHTIHSCKNKNAPVKQEILEILPEDIWKQVLRHLVSSFQTLESCSEASNMFEDLIEKAGLLFIGPTKIVPSNFGNRISLHRGITPIPRLTTFEFCDKSNLEPTEPMACYLNCILKSQRDSLEILRISWLVNRHNSLNLDLPRMKKLRDLTLVRKFGREKGHGYIKSMRFRKTAFLPALQSLTLSAFGGFEHWRDFLEKPKRSDNSKFPTCETINYLRIVPVHPIHVQYMMEKLSEKFVLPHLVSLEMPAGLLNKQIHSLFEAPESLKRLTLSLPTEDFHKHLFDVAITGYGDQVCAAILANPDRDPVEIREEIEEENERRLSEEPDDKNVWKLYRVQWDNRLRREGRHWPNITGFLGLEELTLKSDTADWGPTVVSCADLLNMNTLKTLRFSGFYPKCIPNNMMHDLKERFTVTWD